MTVVLASKSGVLGALVRVCHTPIREPSNDPAGKSLRHWGLSQLDALPDLSSL